MKREQFLWRFLSYSVIDHKFVWPYLNSAWKFGTITTWKVSKYGVFSGPYFPIFGLNTEIYSVNLCIQSEYRKIRTRKNSVFGYFSRSESITTNYIIFQGYLSNTILVQKYNTEIKNWFENILSECFLYTLPKCKLEISKN